MNQSYARVNAPYANHAHAPEMCLECNCAKNNARALLSRILRIVQFCLAASMYVLYAECMNAP